MRRAVRPTNSLLTTTAGDVKQDNAEAILTQRPELPREPAGRTIHCTTQVVMLKRKKNVGIAARSNLQKPVLTTPVEM